LALLLIALSLSGCVAYPKFYWQTKTGQARVEDGKPVQIKASIVRDCETLEKDEQTTIKEISTTTDGAGKYSLTVRGWAWHWKNLFSLNGCISRIQMFVCRPNCIEADDVDIDILGK
jgi:hypothetical protein